MMKIVHTILNFLQTHTNLDLTHFKLEEFTISLFEKRYVCPLNYGASCKLYVQDENSNYNSSCPSCKHRFHQFVVNEQNPKKNRDFMGCDKGVNLLEFYDFIQEVFATKKKE